MARGRKKFNSPEEQLQAINDKIVEKENELKALKAEKKDVELKIKEQRLGEIDALLNEKGISIEDLKQIINKK